LSTPVNVNDLISNNEVEDIEVYESNKRKQITWITPLLTNSESLAENLIDTLSRTSSNTIASGCA